MYIITDKIYYFCLYVFLLNLRRSQNGSVKFFNIFGKTKEFRFYFRKKKSQIYIFFTMLI